MGDYQAWRLTRRMALLKGGLVAAVAGSGLRLADGRARAGQVLAAGDNAATALSHGHGDDNTVVGDVDHAVNGFDPWQIATEFDYGKVTVTADGRRLREWTVRAEDRDIEIAPGVKFAAWTFNGRIPGPTLRCVEGERLRITLVNASAHPHSMHFHGIHAARMDGVPGAGLVEPGGTFVYKFDAAPFGCHLYHCHALPLKRHIHKGLYGVFIVDPDPARHPEAAAAANARRHGAPEHARWQEYVLVMNGFDTNFDDENEFYAVNTVPFAYFKRPLRIERARPVRLYLVNITEFDPINSLHVHANFFDYYDHGTTLTPTLRTVDTIMQCQGQRGIVEMSFARHEPGLYMFHAHQSEFAELGWMSHFEVVA